MNNRDFEELRRRLNADLGNTALQIEFIQARARIEGSSVYLEPLLDRDLWNTCPHPLQDMAIQEVHRLQPEYKWLETQLYSCGGASHRIASFQHLQSQMILHLLPGQRWRVLDSKENSSDVKDQGAASVKPLLVGRYPVTRFEWQQVQNESNEESKWPDMPRTGVSWNDCQDWLRKAGGDLRFLNQSEWEYACRSGTKSRYFWGDILDDKYLWYRENSQLLKWKVSQHQSQCNAFGLVDMIGHVWEWCSGKRYGYSPAGRQEFRVCRGASFLDSKELMDPKARGNRRASYRDGSTGLRVALDCSLAECS